MGHTGEGAGQSGILARRLKELRDESGLTGAELASRMDWRSRSKIPKIEKGQQLATEDDIRRWAAATGHPELADELVSMLPAAEVVHAQWKHQLRQGQAALQGDFDTIVREASRIRDFQTFCLPGLLQTPDYVRYRALEATRVHGTDPAKVDEVVAARMRRQDVLWDTSKTFEFLILQAALDYLLCPPNVLLGQLDRLQTVIGLPNVRFGIIPRGRELAVCPMIGFLMADELVVVETFTSADSLLGKEAQKYAEILDLMWADAVEGEAARQLITTAAEPLRGAITA